MSVMVKEKPGATFDSRYSCKAEGEKPPLGRKTDKKKRGQSKSDMLAAEITTSLHLKIHL